MKLGIECAYSYEDLYKAAFGREPSQEEMADFGRATQPERNLLVKMWAAAAGWATDDRIGTDGVIYTAFAPKDEG